jgi:hypothetical protein
VIRLLARFFRGLSFVFGITAPPENEDQRPFVFAWLGIIAFSIGFTVLMFYVIVHLAHR